MELTREQIEVFAAGLYAVAESDGIDEKEVALIEEFLRDAGAPDLTEGLSDLSFDPVEAYATLGSTWLRTLFLKCSLMVIRADHEITTAEQETLVWIAGVFGVDGGYDTVVKAIEGESI
jgi:tellurite resistance protein